MRSSNPTLISNPFSGFRLVSESNGMTIGGTVNKTAILLLLVILPAAWVWRMFLHSGHHLAIIEPWMFVGLIGGLIFSLATIFKKNWAPITAPLYAAMEGLFLGSVSVMFEQTYSGIILQAVSLSIGTLLTMLIAYQLGWVKATERFKLGVTAATGGIALVYFISIILGFFGISVSFITSSSLFSILFSVFVVAVAALNFVLDFDFIEQGSRSGVPKYMEWYGAFALMVTLVWLYLEVLRLLAKMNERR